MTEPPTDRARVRDLVARCLEQLDERGSAVIDELCCDVPHLKDAVRRRLASLERLGLVKPGATEATRFPEQLGEFRLLRCIGGGGMGVVYLAEQTTLGRKVALKLVRPEQLYFPNARERFRREVDAVARLRHPAVIPIYTFGEAGDLPYYAMEWVDGASLEEVLHVLRGRRPQDLSGSDLRAALQACRDARAADTLPIDTSPPIELPGSPFEATSWVEVCFRLMLPVAHALEHAHRQGVVHRDLKPSNLMLTRDGRVLVVDFGLASTSGTSRLTKSGAQLGSLPYTPPELIRGGAAAGDEKGDVYSFGVTLYELLTLSHAFGGSGEEGGHAANGGGGGSGGSGAERGIGVGRMNVEQTRAAILAGAARPLRERHTTIPWDAETVCLVAMERDPARRYATAEALAADLQAVLSRRPIQARRPGVSLRLLRLAQRHPAAAVGVIAAAILLLVVPGAIAWQQQLRNADLVRMNRQLGERVTAEQAARAKAERNAERTRAAVKEFLDGVGNVALANVPGAEPLRRDLLARAVAIYQELFSETPTDAVRNELAVVTASLANRDDELGQASAARAGYQRALALFDATDALPTTTFDDRRARARVLGDWSSFLAQHGEPDAMNALRAAVAAWKALAAERPNAATRVGYSLALTELAGSLEIPIEESRELVREILEQVAEPMPGGTLDHTPDAPRDDRDEHHFAVALATLATHFAILDDNAAAETLLLEAISRLERLDRAVPQHFATMHQMAISKTQLGQLLRVADRPAEAQEALQGASRVATRLRELFPSRPDLAANVGHIGLLRGECFLDVGDAAAAETTLEEAIHAFEAALAAAPIEPMALQFRGPTVRVLARARLERGDLDGARAALRQAVELLTESAAAESDPAWSRSELAEAWLYAAAHPDIAPQHDGQGDEATTCALRAVDEAALAIGLAPSVPAFAEVAREAAAIALAALLARGDEGSRTRARELLERLAAIGAIDPLHLEEARELAPLLAQPAFLELIAERESH